MTYDYDDIHEALRKAIGPRHGAITAAANAFGVTLRHMQRMLKGEHKETTVRCLREMGYTVEITVSVQSPEESV